MNDKDPGRGKKEGEKSHPKVALTKKAKKKPKKKTFKVNLKDWKPGKRPISPDRDPFWNACLAVVITLLVVATIWFLATFSQPTVN